ncbi:MAG: hypothetical protein MJK12_15495 [Colwellia sp.]|nr:hypothetical protein [Colwellia sp.]
MKYEELKPNNFENKVSGVKSKLSTQLNDEIKAKCLSDFFKEKLSQEYTRISYSMSKLTSYRTFLLFLVGAGIALSKLYFELFDFLTTITIFIIYYYYCFSLYHVISSAISVSSINMSSSGDYKWDKCNKDLAITYIYDLVNVRYSADKKVSLVKCAEKYLQMTFLLMMILTSAYFIFDSIKKVTPPNLNNEKSFSIYNNSGEFDLSEFSLFVSKLKNHAGSIYIVHCTQSKKVDDLNTLFSVISVEKIDLIFIETNETNFCNGLTVIHF